MGCCQSKPVTQDLGGLAEENPLRMHQLHQQPLKLAMLVRVGRMLYVPKERSPDGYPEAYCIVTLEGSDSSKGQLPPSNLRQNKQQHTSAKNHSSEIVWNENVELSTPSGSANGLTLVINVYDKDTFSSDDFIGVAKVPASEWEPHLDRGTRIKRELQDVPLDRQVWHAV